MSEYLTFINTQVIQLGWVVVTPLLFLENIPIIGFIVPGVTVLFTAGFLSSSISGGSLFLFIACILALIIADTIWYALGRVSRGKWRLVKHVAKRSPNVEELMANQPFLYLIFYQFIPYFRMFLPFALGVYQVSFNFWLLLVTISSILFVSVFFGAGMVSATYISAIINTEQVMQGLNITIFLVAATYTIYLTVRYLRIRRKNCLTGQTKNTILDEYDSNVGKCKKED